MLLIVSDDRKKCFPIVKQLIPHGIFSFLCPYETAEFMCEKKDVGGVLLDCVAGLGKGERLCKIFRSRYPEMPIGAIISQGAIPNMEVNRLIRTPASESILDGVLDFCICNCGWRTKKLSTHYLAVEDDPARTVYMGYPLDVSPREHEILRCLFYRAPYVTTKDDLLTLCYPEGMQSHANLSIQIGRINRSAARIDPRPLIVNVYGKGYKLRDGIV